ncbi:MAG: urease accessory protein UreF [Porticoccaceae bacterium]
MTIATTPTMPTTNMTTDNGLPRNNGALLQLLRFSSPSLPIGGFAWSQGLESAIDRGWLVDGDALADWLGGVLRHSFAQQELPLLRRLLVADADAFVRWNRHALALRETAELRAQDVQTGGALLRLLRSLNVPAALAWPTDAEIGHLAAYAFACRHHGIGYELAATGLVWSWLDNQIGAALKLFPLGQTAGQLVLEGLVPRVGEIISQATDIEDGDIGISLAGAALASMLHETQYSRLFRS